MSNGYGYSGSSSSSSSSSSARQSTVNTQGQVAPPGFHYMPDGTLMSDAEHARLYDNKVKVLNEFDIDFSDLPATSESRTFTISGDVGAEFRLEIKDKDTGKYYNFVTNSFQTAVAFLEKELNSNTYIGNIVFPAVTGGDDQYDIYLFAKHGTEHAAYNEVKFGDGTINLNRSTGSNSLLMQKVIYQYAALTLTISPFSPNATIAGTLGSDTVTSVARGKAKASESFSITVTAASDKSYKIVRQPVADDIVSFVSPTVGATGTLVTLPGENIYPTATAAFTGDDINGAVTSGSVVRMDNTDLSAVIKVGDKITTPVTTDTVDGAVSSSNRIVMDNNVATKMAVGDQVTGTGIPSSSLVTVTHLNPDTDNVKELQVSEAVSISDGVTLTFSSKINRSLTTVTVVETSGVATDFTMSQAIQFRDNAPLTFFNQMNYQWYLNTGLNLIEEGMSVTGSSQLQSSTEIGSYKDSVIMFEGTEQETEIVKNTSSAINTFGVTPVVTKGLVSTQAGYVVFNKQQQRLLATESLRIGGYGVSEAKRLYGYEIELSNLKIELTTITTTTTSAVTNSTTVPVLLQNGILAGDVATVSGIGIDPTAALPTVSSRAAATTAGNLTLSAAQTLENGITLSFDGCGQVATITGDIRIIKAGTENQTIRFDIEKLLTIH
tara:strand:- start:767 stop:2758 length:1992 start_codon:yes stop_codon:yes gene_type:complete